MTLKRSQRRRNRRPGTKSPGGAGAAPSGPSSAVRALVAARDRMRCVRCGRPVDAGPVNVHHRIGRGMGGTLRRELDQPANLVLLCGSGTTGCHGEVTSGSHADAEARGLVLDRNARPPINPADRPIYVHGRGWVLLDNHGGWIRTTAPAAA